MQSFSVTVPSIARAAARDSSDPKGKSPGLAPEFDAGRARLTPFFALAREHISGTPIAATDGFRAYRWRWLISQCRNRVKVTCAWNLIASLSRDRNP